MTREEHIDWCKQRALAYLPHDHIRAFTSLASDLDKHPETKGHRGINLGMKIMMNRHLQSPDQMCDFIKGFNRHDHYPPH